MNRRGEPSRLPRAGAERNARIDAGGFTLIELVISLALAALIAGGTLQFHRVATRQAAGQQQLAEMQQNLRLAMRVVERAVRSAGLGVEPAEGRYSFQFSDSNLYADPKRGFVRDPQHRDDDPDWFRVVAADSEGTARTTVFRVDLSDRERPRLMTATPEPGEEAPRFRAVTDYIEDMQIALVLADGSICGTAKNAVDDPSVCDPKEAVAVRVTLVARSAKKLMGLATSEVGGYEDRRTVQVTDHYLRRALTSEIQLRNFCPQGVTCP